MCMFVWIHAWLCANAVDNDNSNVRDARYSHKHTTKPHLCTWIGTFGHVSCSAMYSLASGFAPRIDLSSWNATEAYTAGAAVEKKHRLYRVFPKRETFADLESEFPRKWNVLGPIIRATSRRKFQAWVAVVLLRTCNSSADSKLFHLVRVQWKRTRINFNSWHLNL